VVGNFSRNKVAAMNDFKIWKMVWEVRYPAASALFDSRGKIATKWQWMSDLSEWRISSNQVTIHNKSNTTFLNAGLKNSSVVMELPESSIVFNGLATDFSSWLLEILDIKKIERIGLRIIQIAKRPHFKLLATKMRQSLFGLSDDDWQIFGGPPDDIGFSLTLTLNENNAIFNIGPMKFEQLNNYFEAKEVKERLPATALFMDFDFFKNEPEISTNDYHESFSNFLKLGTNQVSEISDKIMERYGAFK
jgi:hypothetical protein